MIHFQSFLFYMKIVHRLLPGEALTFNNRRVLHSWTPMRLNGGVRHLQVGGNPSQSNTSSIVFMKIHHSWGKKTIVMYYSNYMYMHVLWCGYLSVVFALWAFCKCIYLSCSVLPGCLYEHWYLQVEVSSSYFTTASRLSCSACFQSM